MPSAAESLDTAISNIAALIAQITADPKPNYSIDGQLVSWGDYLDTLTTKLASLQKSRQMAAGPYQRATRFRSM
jgi:hypothetical protein